MKMTEELERFQELIVAAFDGDKPDHAAIIRDAGYIDPREGIQQKILVENKIVSRPVLMQWEKDGLISGKIGKAKYYPIVEFIKFVVELQLKSRGGQSKAF